MFFGRERFVDLCVTGACFVCGIPAGAVKFNDEHVIPRWVLRRFGLHNRRITLPNGSSIPYRQYTVPCCVNCNGRLGKDLEDPIAGALADGQRSLEPFVQREGVLRVLAWLSCLLLKTHLKDRTLRAERDLRKGRKAIASAYDWEQLRHAHTLARAPYAGTAVDARALGTIIFVSADNRVADHFDYGDLYLAQTVMVRHRDLAIVAVLDDAGATGKYLGRTLDRIRGHALSPLQLRELMVRMGYANLRLRSRPVFESEAGAPVGGHRLSASIPASFEFDEADPEMYGALLDSACGPAIEELQSPAQAAETRAHMRQGRWSFLFDGDGSVLPGVAQMR